MYVIELKWCPHREDKTSAGISNRLKDLVDLLLQHVLSAQTNILMSVKNDELVRQKRNIFQNVALSIVKKRSDLFPEYFVVTFIFKPIWLKSMEKESPKKAVNTKQQ